MRAVRAAKSDIPSWLDIAQEVEPLFGPMPDFGRVLARKIAEGTAICVHSDDADSRVGGGILLGGASPIYWIRWLAVRGALRNRGIGRCLVDEALQRFRPPCQVRVDTFRAGFAPDDAARHLYQAAGFRPGELVEAFGQPRQRFVLVRE
jgi:GNAT superfamily N-acetyltransferase